MSYASGQMFVRCFDRDAQRRTAGPERVARNFVNDARPGLAKPQLEDIYNYKI